jgi:prepilin-type N-terminal cleavage/methylation domain-containing protein
MRLSRTKDAGVTMIELLVAIGVFSVVSVSFYSVLFAVQRGSENARSVAEVSEEARLGFNRMVRDTREGLELVSASESEYTVRVDFENDNLGPQDLTYRKTGNEVQLNGETLMEGVDCIREGDSTAPCVQDVFRYTSNRLEFDWNGDGITSWEELDASADPAHGVIGVGNDDDRLNVELPFVTDVMFALQVSNDESDGDLIASAQLRNRR